MIVFIPLGIAPARLCGNANKHDSHTYTHEGTTYYCPGIRS